MLVLVTRAQVGQRLDCRHLVAEGRPVYPVRLRWNRQTILKSACSPECERQMAEEWWKMNAAIYLVAFPD